MGHLLEGRRRPAVPEIPEKETLENGHALRPVKPVLGSKRSGALAYKIGCMSLWDDWGEKHMVTVCQLDRLRVVQQMTLQKNGYEALQMGLGYRSTHRQKRAALGACIKAGVGPKHHICEFRVSSDCLLPVGHQITVRHFVPGQWVFVSGWSKAKGYHGVMKRWGFAGGGSDKRGHRQVHRASGSVGQRGAGKVWKGKKKAGHMGPDPRCVNALVFRVEAARNLIFLKGTLPGHKGSIVKISDARGKTALKNNHIRLPHPTFVPVPEVEYPVTIQMPPPQRDPFLYPEQPLYQEND
uniref:Large ribosomal subunit protein uL3m n=1 Tax=Zooxanthella nutricula TaxID=1333877 RepID=A0A7S2LYR3_9DINO